MGKSNLELRIVVHPTPGTRLAILLLQIEADTASDHLKWPKLELGLVLAHATGRRLGSIRQLAWDQVDFNSNVIFWRAESDKKKKEWKVPMPDAQTTRGSRR